MRVNRKKRMRESSATPLTSISVIQSKGSSCQRRTPFVCRKSERNDTPRSATHPLCITNRSLPLPLHQCSITAATASEHQTTRTPLTGPPFQSEALPFQLSRHQNIIYRYIDQKKKKRISLSQLLKLWRLLRHQISHRSEYKEEKKKGVPRPPRIYAKAGRPRTSSFSVFSTTTDQITTTTTKKRESERQYTIEEEENSQPHPRLRNPSIDTSTYFCLSISR